MTAQDLLRRYWRVVVVGLLAAVLAFGASFAVSDRYESSTRLLVHGRDATFLTSTGQDLSTQPGVVDASLSQALLSTYAGIATSRAVAVSVVDELHLDQVRPATTPYALLKQGARWTYRCAKAVVTSGFCAKADPRESAVLGIQKGTTAEPTGTNEGANAGTQSSYVLELTSSGSDPVQAEAVTDALADQLVTLSNERFTRDADANVATLQDQVDQLQQEVSARTQEVATYQDEHAISAGDAKLALAAATSEDVRADLGKARADLSDTQAQLASIAGSLAEVPRDQRVRQRIVTGRSTTQTETDQVSTVYNDLLGKQSTLEAQEAGLKARIDRLEQQSDSSRPLAKNKALAQLTVLQQRADLAGQDLQSLNAVLQKARTTAAQGSVDLSRIDQASLPTYPAEPKRYIYLALGLLIGALAGAFLTVRAERRAALDDPAGDDEPVDGDPAPTGHSANGHVRHEDEGLDILRADEDVAPRRGDPGDEVVAGASTSGSGRST